MTAEQISAAVMNSVHRAGLVEVEVSARHVHLSQADLDCLFGPGHSLHPCKALSQPGQFACEERVTVVGPKKELKGVSILGPCRKATQVELSLTDARSIGVAAPVRESGDTAGSAPCNFSTIFFPVPASISSSCKYISTRESTSFFVSIFSFLCFANPFINSPTI